MLSIFRSERGFSVPGGMLAAAGVGAILAGSYVYSQGLIRVSVNEKHTGGEHIRLAVPGAVVPLVMALVPAREIGRHMPAEARQHLSLIEAALDQLQRLPDCTLVRVEGPGEHVRIQVKNGQMVVDVNDLEEEVHVTLPMSSLHSVMAKLGRAAQVASDEEDGVGEVSDIRDHAGHRGCRHHDEDQGRAWEEKDDTAGSTRSSTEAL